MDEILERNQTIMATAESQLLSSVDDVEREIWQLVERRMRDFNTQGGKFVVSDATPQLINSLKGDLRDIVKRSSFPEYMDDFFANFDEIGQNVAAINGEVSGINVPRSLVNRQKQFAIESTLFTMLDSNISLKFVDPIKRALFNHVNFGAGVLDAEAEIRTMILGGDEKLGALRQWVGQIARDSMHQYEGGINQRVKVEYDLNGIEYVGTAVQDSRPQCKRWLLLGKIKDEDLEKEIRWARRYGSGLIPDTTPGTFCVYRGGYSCRHSGYPIRI